MFKTVDEAADAVTDIFIEKMADGFLDSLKGMGGKAMGGLRNAGNYMVNKGPGTLHGALGGNDAAHWGILGAAGLGGLGAIKGLIAPDEGKSRGRSMISNAALGALMGGAGGVAGGVALGKNPALNGNIFGGSREKHDLLQGNVNKAKAELDVNRARAALGPIGAATAALGNAETTGITDAGMTAGKELIKPIGETGDNLTQSGMASVGAQMARRRFQLGHLNNITTPDIQVGPQGWNKLNPFAGNTDLAGHTFGTANSVNTIEPRVLQDAANKVMSNSKAPAAPPTMSPLTPPSLGSSVNTANMPAPLPGAPHVPSSKLNMQELVAELEKSLPSGGTGKSMLPEGFHNDRLSALKGYGGSAKGIQEIEEALRNGTGVKYNAKVPLGGTFRGALGAQLGGQMVASQLRNLPRSLQRIRELDGSQFSHPDKAFMANSIPPGEIQVAEQALQKFLEEQAARGGK